jgi:Ca-activated chloride channel family protein
MAHPFLATGKTFALAAFVAGAAMFASSCALSEDGVNSCQTDAMIVFDASGSMGTTDYTLKLPRIARVKQSMARVLPEVAPVRRLGLIVYGEGAYNDCTSIQLRLKPTRNAAAPLLNIISGIDPRGRTPLTESVRLAAETLDYTKRDAVVVLLTDGEETCGGDPCKTAALLKLDSPNLTIHVVGYRDEQGTYFKARCMADETGGKYFSVSTEDELVDALRKTLGCPFLTEREYHDRTHISEAHASGAQSPRCAVGRAQEAAAHARGPQQLLQECPKGPRPVAHLNPVLNGKRVGVDPH